MPARTGRDELALWIAVAVAFAPALAALAREWASVEYYNHGFLVPLVSLAAAQPRWRRLGASQRRPAGLGLLAASAVPYLMGLAAASAALQGLGVILALAGGVVWRWGARGLRAHAFALGFLLFMLPLPAPWVNPVILALQGLASAAAVETLQAFGVAVLRDGNVVRLPAGGSLFVAEACSGITSLLSLIPIGVVLARFTERATWRRLLIVAAMVPAALLGNALRVIATVAAADAWGVERATSGALHESAGLLTSAFAVLLVIALGVALRRLIPDGPAAEAA